MYECELTLTGKNRVTIKRTTHGVVAIELSKPGSLRDGHGWLVVDGVFLDPADIESLLDVLGADSSCSGARLPDGAMVHTTAEPLKYGASCSRLLLQAPANCQQKEAKNRQCESDEKAEQYQPANVT